MNRSLPVAAFFAAALSVSAQTAPSRLSPLVVSADRTPEDPALLPSSVTPLEPADLQLQQISDLRTALAQAPGVAVVGTGATGAQTSVFVRGANSDQTLFVADGVRLNTPADTPGNFLGAADLSGLDRVEVLLGPQSTLYGSNAMGGVILLETAHAAEQPTGNASFEAGSFGTLRGAVAGSGAAGPLGVTASFSHEVTDNARPNNAFQAWNYSTRVEDRATPWLLAGITFRGVDSHYEEPGPTPSFFPSAAVITSGTHLGTAYLQVDPGSDLRSRITVAWYQDQYAYDDGSPYDYYRFRSTRRTIEWQTNWTPTDTIQAVAGADGEWSREWSGTASSDRLLAAYGLGIWHPAKLIEVTAGIRHDAYVEEGSATTGRLGASFAIPGGGPTWRATYGSGFEAPTTGDRLGTPPYLLANPAVRPERSRGWDAGFDQAFAGGHVRFAATWFANRFTDLLEYSVVDFTTYAGQEINVDHASTRGAEATLSADLGPRVTARGAYTYLEAQDDLTGARLLRRPRQAADAAIEIKLGTGGLAGFGVRALGDRIDGVDAPAPLGGYATWRLFFRYPVFRDVFFTARLENAFNRHYEELAGYPALPRGAFAGVEWRR